MYDKKIKKKKKILTCNYICRTLNHVSIIFEEEVVLCGKLDSLWFKSHTTWFVLLKILKFSKSMEASANMK